MKSVSELMEECSELVMSDECRSVSCRLCEVHDCADERPVLYTVPDALATEVCHPCAASLACAREEVSVEESKVAAVYILHLVDLHILVIYRNIVKLGEADAVKACSKTEYSVDAALKLEIRLEFLCAERIFRLLVLL